MPSPKNYREGGHEENEKGKLSGKTSSGGTGLEMQPRTRTAKEFFTGKRVVANLPALPHGKPKLTKLLVNVTIQRSLGAVQVVMAPEATVDELIAAVLRLHEKGGRRPVFPSTSPSGFDLHYSQFSLESINREENLMALGSRNFFLCPKKKAATTVSHGAAAAAGASSKEVAKPSYIGLHGLKLMDILL
ncbi:uncharacterized protein At4g22758-like [Olea europaea var. sylvestris]|uniref:uncharacterized protein At4g22758-like n=1 Tax=Olea europaea var. sylvestris TaxID=158386 RepID=UPI000C1D0F35|nr:uncharacterized protein At4g22758-like [Olea europaea var. sylvestris]